MSSHYRNAGDRQPNDLYATRPHDVELLYKYEPSIINGKIWECACGHGHISETLKKLGATDVYSSDLIDYGYGDVINFLTDNTHYGKFDTIFTNPPYKYATQFITHALNQIEYGNKVIMLLPTSYLAGIQRYTKIFYKNPPKYVYVFARNTYALLVADNDNKVSSNDISHSWFIWEKGFNGDTIIRWLYDGEEIKEKKPKEKSDKKNTSVKSRFGVPGVRFKDNAYEVRIKVNGRYIHIGRFKDLNDAIDARLKAEAKYREHIISPNDYPCNECNNEGCKHNTRLMEDKRPICIDMIEHPEHYDNIGEDIEYE